MQTVVEFPTLEEMVAGDEPADAYFDQKFASAFGIFTERNEEETLGIIRQQADQFVADPRRYKAKRHRYAHAIQDACQAIIRGYSSQMEGDPVSKYDAASVIAKWNLAWAYGALVARSGRVTR